MANYFCYLGNGNNNIIGPKFFEKYCYDKKNSEDPDSTETIFSLGNLPINTCAAFNFRKSGNELYLDVYFHSYEAKPGIWKNFLKKVNLTYKLNETIKFYFTLVNKESKIILIDYNDDIGSILNKKYWDGGDGYSIGALDNNYWTLNRDNILADYDTIFTGFDVTRISETAFLITTAREA